MCNANNPDNIIQYIRKNVGPVPYSKLIAHFCQRWDNEAEHADAKEQLDKILAACIDTGIVIHFNNQFFAGTHAEDMEHSRELNQIEDTSPNLSSNSLSIFLANTQSNSELFCEANDHISEDEEDDEEYEYDDDDNDNKADPLNSVSILSTQSTQLFNFPSYCSSFSNLEPLIT